MESLFELTTIDEVIGSCISGTDFKSFCESIDELAIICSPDLYLEAVKDVSPSLRNGVKEVKKNTIDTTRDVAGAYMDVVDGNSKLIKGTWDLVMRSIRLITRVLNFVLTKISKIPLTIIKLANAIGDIPENVRNKIKGNINLYITVNDIQDLYTKSMMVQIDTFIGVADTLSKGTLWGTFFHKSRQIVGGKAISSQNDIKACKQLEGIYEKLKYLEFNPTVVQMADKPTVDAYFGNSKSLSFRDLRGNSFSGTYLQALQLLIKDLEARKDTLKRISDDLGDKYNATQLNGTFGKLHKNDQYRITSMIRMMSKMINIIGNFIRYVMIDVNTIEKTVKKLTKKGALPTSAPTSTP